ncbi:Xylem bark cysteine peptidase 3 isoform 1 [Hibiscus syriacus]|uniref:Xylem bark cysteine peptidase 3 isoform 1 n=1 Tax=Hibiscus syriacus TaxID=106335 RepID=A0A6A2WJY9_HIBSY|nr:uncharacterized protein LOC120194845 [Hibiscus syriacus]KAE8656375.1 Xylem bark cysteine peptidase 3 isoform 1 [Hibiscus syriacus]
MEEGKLNFNAPLLSVRRLSSTHCFSAGDKQKIVANSSYTRARILPSNNSDVSLVEVTEHVAVPFVWEQIPGKAKGGPQHEFQPDKEASFIPEPPSGRVSHVIKYPVERDSRNQYVLRPQHSMNDDVSGLQCSNEGMNEKCILELEDEDDVYSDALDTLSTAKPSMAPDHPLEVREVASGYREPLVNQYESFIVPRSGVLRRTIRGLLPRLCFMNSVCLFIPIPGLKVRTRSSISSNCDVAKPGKTTSIKSGNQIVEKNGWDVCNNKSDSRVQSFRLPENKSDNEAQMRRLLEDKSESEVESHRLPEIGGKVSCRSSRFSSANDLQMVTWLPLKRPTGNARIPPYRREKPQSPFSGEGFLGMPKQAEKFKANMLVKNSNSTKYSKELVPYQNNQQGSDSLSLAVEKTLYVDTVKISSSISNSSDTIVTNRMLEEPASVGSSLQDIQGLDLLDRKGI